MIKPLNMVSCLLFGLSIVFSGTTSYGETQVSGNIITNTTWSKSNGPYIITGTVQVYPNVTLMIEPGVVIKFNLMAGLKIGGKLIARGLEDEPITFTANVNPVPVPFYWNSIEFVDPCVTTLFDPDGNYLLSGSILENCIIEFGRGITTTQSKCNPFITKSTFNTSGIRLDWGASPIIIKDNDINNGFIWAKSNKVNILNNSISKTFQGWDIVAEGENVAVSNNTVASGSIRVGGQCSITNNHIEGGGICTGYDGCGDLSRSGYCYISDNILSGFGGITLNYGGYISNNDIQGYYGILVRNLNETTTIIGNTIRNSYFEAINIKNRNQKPSLSVIIKNNKISENLGKQAGGFGGIYYMDKEGYLPGNLIVSENDIFGNVPYNLYNDSSSQIDATNNWWGTTDIGVIGQYIFDYYDDFTKGIVSIEPISLSPFFPQAENISIPNIPSGPTSGAIETSYTYTTAGSTSSLGHSVEYQFDWKGDASDLSPWGPATQSKTCTVAGSYNVRARARCATDTSVVSDWSSGLSVTISGPTISNRCDFNGDDKTDILWRNTTTSQNVVWFMNGAAFSSYSWIDTVTDTNWQIVGTGDFNNDGKTDILWRNKSTGQNIVWYMNGAAFSNYGELMQVPDTNWQIVGTGDFNNDGKTDILWRNKSTGQNIVWLMNGTTYSSYAELLQVPDTNWEIVGTGDFNGDGKTDILWRNKSTGQNILWLMNGTTYSSYAELMQVPDTNWEIVGPK